MNKIFLNNDVWDRYVGGSKLNDAISEVFYSDIQDRVKENESFSKMSPLQMVMHDAGIKGDSKLQSMMRHDVNNSAYTSGGMETNQWLFPAWVETTLREAMYETDYLPYLVNTRIGIDGNTVQSPMLDLSTPENKKAIKKARIAEGADIPTGKITIGERAITLWKHGRAIELTYEAARRMRVDLFNIQMRAIASDLAHQNMESAIDVALNGDGNNNAAQKLATTTDAGVVSSDDFIGALYDYQNANHYNANTAVMSKKHLLAVSKMTYDPTLANGASLRVTFDIPQIKNQNITLIGVDELTVGGKDVILLMNRDFSLVRYEENGSNIQEMDNFIRNQMKLMTLTENSGYAVNVAGANKYIEVK